MTTNSSENVTVEAADEKKPPPPPSEVAPKCPRCDSDNTKFCYYNNYSLSQPRYFCKSCRRYWTKGGTLRNVPIGGGCRKNKRSVKRSLDRSYSHDLLLQSLVENNSNNNAFSNFSSPALSYESSGSGESLSMAFARLQKQCNGHGPLGFGFGFELQNFTQAPSFDPIMTSQTTCFDSQTMYNYGLLDANVSQSYGHTQPLVPYEGLSFDLMSGGGVGGSVQKLDMCDNDRIFREFPWQMGINNGHGGVTLEKNEYIFNENLVLGGSSIVENGVAGGTESASAPSSWPNLINTSVLM